MEAINTEFKQTNEQAARCTGMGRTWLVEVWPLRHPSFILSFHLLIPNHYRHRGTQYTASTKLSATKGSTQLRAWHY
jgi:hypothetical protein